MCKKKKKKRKYTNCALQQLQLASPSFAKQKKITFTPTIKVTVLHKKEKKALRTQSLLLNLF